MGAIAAAIEDPNDRKKCEETAQIGGRVTDQDRRMESFLDVFGVRRPSLLPLMGAQRTVKRNRTLKIVGLVARRITCLASMQMLTNHDEALIVTSFVESFTSATYTEAESIRPPAIEEPAVIIDVKESCSDVMLRAEALPEVDSRHPEQTIADMVLQGWEDDWIAHGIVDKEKSKIEPYKLDFVYTYVQSDEDFFNMKRPYDAESKKANDLRWQILQASRFRSWDELKYSIRGTVKNAASWLSRINIVTKDFQRFDAERNETVHVVQRPAWIDDTGLQDHSRILIIPETSILNNSECSPTFNSVSVESSFGNVPLTTEHFIGLSDDMFIGKQASAADFVSPIFGMSFSWYHDMWALNEAKEPNLNDGELGEGHAVRHTSYLLGKRFGMRPRTLQLHQAKVINQKILNEAMGTFPKSAFTTPLSRYRDDEQQLYSWYLHMHYTMEMHRESLLWAIAMRFDRDEDEQWDLSERAQFLEEVNQGKSGNGRRHVMPMLGQIEEKFRNAGLDGFKIQTVDHTSLDGPQQIKHLTFEFCEEHFSIDTCFGPDFTNDTNAHTTAAFFQRITSPTLDVSCGDCLIKYLLNNADIGLSSLLPHPGSIYRERAVKAIHKYQYTETSPDNAFLMVRNENDARALPGYASVVPGLMCINDDVTTMSPHALSEIALGYHQFYEATFPEPSIFEKTLSQE